MLQYPSAAASAVVLTVVLMATVALILRTVDIRKEIARWSAAPNVMPQVKARARRHAIAPSRGRRPWTFYVLAALFVFYVTALYGPMICIYILSFQDVRGGLVFPMKGLSLHWFVDLFTQVRTGDVKGAFGRSIKTGDRGGRSSRWSCPSCRRWLSAAAFPATPSSSR